MTERLFLEDAYATRAEATVIGHTAEGGVLVDRSIFYATSGGQPGDSGKITWNGGELEIATAVKADAWQIALVPAEVSALPPVGTAIEQRINWDPRFRHMRVHTALHLLSVIIPLPVTGGSLSAAKGRLDFDMSEPPEDKTRLESELNDLVFQNLSVCQSWITDAELKAKPELVKTMSVAPPIGEGRVRLIRIGDPGDPIDVQPCGGTHVSTTAEIGEIRIGKVEKKGRQNRRVYIHIGSE